MTGIEPIGVLIVEDEPIAAKANRTYVERVPGFRVVKVVGSGAEALRVLRSSPVELCLLDMNLPDMHGLDICRAMRAAGHRADVIAVTSARDLAVVRAAVSTGIVQYLLKPFTFPALRERLERYADFRRQVDLDRQVVDQHEVDQALAVLRGSDAAPPPKGVSGDTLRSVADTVRAAAAPLSAGELGERVGVSRITARRYLEFLTERGQVRRTARYGGTGRPEYEYAWIGSDRGQRSDGQLPS